MQLSEKQYLDWNGGIQTEIQFWNNWLKGGSDDPSDTLAVRTDKNRPLQAEIRPFVADLSQPEVSILDVGAGPITWLGRRLEGIELSITATDILAEKYRDLLAEHNVASDLPTKFGPIEDLSLFFPESGFDIVFCRHALDYTQDPLRGLNEMLRCVRVGGKIILISRRNYAEFREYTGFNQFNIDVEDDKLLIWNRAVRVDAAGILRAPAQIHADKHSTNVLAVITKTGEFSDTSDKERLRLRAIELAHIATQIASNQIASRANFARVRAEKEDLEGKLLQLSGEVRHLEKVLADERRSALAARQHMLEMESLLADGSKLHLDTIKAIAREVWFEKQRWGVPYKIGKWINRRLGR